MKFIAPLHDKALQYARAGLKVIRLVPGTKEPFRGSRGYLDATTDLEQVDAWWTEQPDANVGIRPPKGLVVLDVDPRNGGDIQLQRLVAKHRPLPETWVARTGSGGWHIWLTVGDLPQIRGELVPGIDVKHCDSGYLVAPPSIHPNGRSYEWISLRATRRGLPRGSGWVFNPRCAQLILQPTARVGVASTASPCLVARITKAPIGERNRTLYGACCDAARQGDLDAFEADLTAAAQATGLDPYEITAAINSARKKAA